MPRNAQFFDRSGRRISEAAAHDERGIMKDGVRMRVQFRDAMNARYGRSQRFTARSFWDAERDSLLVTDARALGGTEGNKPGFRILGNDFGRAAKISALREAERFLNDAWKGSEPTPTGAGDDDKEVDPASDADDRSPLGAGDRRTVDRIAHEHRLRMDRLHAEHSQWLSEQWKQGK
jgi:hypothetical protein